MRYIGNENIVIAQSGTEEKNRAILLRRFQEINHPNLVFRKRCCVSFHPTEHATRKNELDNLISVNHRFKSYPSLRAAFAKQSPSQTGREIASTVKLFRNDVNL